MSQVGSACDDLRHDHPEIRHWRLLFRCWHRGMQTIDLFLGSFAETSLTGLDSAESRVQSRAMSLTSARFTGFNPTSLDPAGAT
jgi:hypothetical protein